MGSSCLVANCENFDFSVAVPLFDEQYQTMAAALLDCDSLVFSHVVCDQQIGSILTDDYGFAFDLLPNKYRFVFNATFEEFCPAREGCCEHAISTTVNGETISTSMQSTRTTTLES